MRDGAAGWSARTRRQRRACPRLRPLADRPGSSPPGHTPSPSYKGASRYLSADRSPHRHAAQETTECRRTSVASLASNGRNDTGVLLYPNRKRTEPWMSRSEPLRFEERETISRELGCGRSVRYIGKLLGRHHSAVSQEISRNGGRDDYLAAMAQDRCDKMRARPKQRKLESCRRLHDDVQAGLNREWSPQQISSRLVKDHPDDPEMRVSHETIY